MLGSALAVESAMPAVHGREAERFFVRENHGFVTRVLWSRGTPRAVLDDAVQQVFLVALPRLAEIENGRAFLYGVALRVAEEQKRNFARHAPPSDPEAADRQISADPGPEQLLDEKQRRKLLDEALESLPDEIRTTFVLFEIEDMTLREIASVTEVPQGTVASRVRRGHELFKKAAARIRARVARQEAP
jgi:RNA polymerase sigma-70 factor (ECF subfamily)